MAYFKNHFRFRGKLNDYGPLGSIPRVPFERRVSLTLRAFTCKNPANFGSVLGSTVVLREKFRTAVLLAVLGLSSGCGARGPSEADIEQSMREFQLAASLRDEGRIPAALERLELALSLDPGNAEAHLLLGFMRYEAAVRAHAGSERRRLLESSAEHLKKGVEILVDRDRAGAVLAEGRNLYGVVLIELGRYEEAEDVLRRSAHDEMNTSPHLAWGNLGLAQMMLGQLDEAVETLTQAVRLQPRFCVGYERLGRAEFERGRLEAAEDALVRATTADESCATNPLFQGAYRLRGEVRGRLGRPDEALSDFTRCVELGAHTEDGRACQGFLDSVN